MIDKAKFIHFIGIGGIGTSSLAQILNKKGKKITGSDNCASEITKSLKLEGIKVYGEHKSKNVTKKHELIVYSPAIPANNPELKKARQLKIQCLSYPQALGELTKKYYTIAITGTHGKSTTTAMTALTAIKGHLDPTVVIGTKLKEFKNKNYRVGDSNYLIIEACEYKRSFLNFHPNILIITNIEAEHLDYYKNLKDYQKAFNELAIKVPKDGYIIFNGDDKNIKPVLKGAKAKIVTWKLNEIKLQPGVHGEFNVKNATNAAIAALLLNISPTIIRKSIKAYKGSWRRMQYKTKKLGKVKFIDDYGHHPTEIRVTLAAIREKYPDAKILCVFQPHQYSRTKLLLKEFGYAFNNVDQVIIPNIYRVRDTEADVKSVSVDDLVKEIRKHQPHAQNGTSLEKTSLYIKKNHKKFDIIVTMGAGDIEKIYKLL